MYCMCCVIVSVVCRMGSGEIEGGFPQRMQFRSTKRPKSPISQGAFLSLSPSLKSQSQGERENEREREIEHIEGGRWLEALKNQPDNSKNLAYYCLSTRTHASQSRSFQMETYTFYLLECVREHRRKTENCGHMLNPSLVIFLDSPCLDVTFSRKWIRLKNHSSKDPSSIESQWCEHVWV